MNQKVVAIIDTETEGLNALFHRIIAIGIKIEKGDKIIKDTFILTKDNEKEMLKEFWELLRRNKVDILVGFNFEFDWQFLKLRSLKHRIKLIPYQKRERYDLRLILNPDKFTKGTKLSDYLTFFDIPNGDEWRGADVPYFYKRGEIQKIVDHLVKDVNSTFDLYRICKEGGLI